MAAFLSSDIEGEETKIRCVPEASRRAGPLASGSGGKRRAAHVDETGIGEQSRELVGVEAGADLAHAAPELLAVVAQQIDDDRAPARTDDARHLGNRERRFGDVRESEQHQAASQAAVRSAVLRARPASQSTFETPFARLRRGGAASRANDRPRSPCAPRAPAPAQPRRCRRRGRRRPSREAAARARPAR